MLRETWWPMEGGEHEVSFALQLLTLELRVYDGPRSDADAWKKTYGPEWLTGTLDWLTWGDEETHAHVDDLKTGRWPVDPATSKQLRTYALLPWVKAGCPARHWECIVSITTWEKYPLDAPPSRKWHRLTPMDMMEHLEDMRWVVAHPDEVNPVPIATVWDPGAAMSPCSFCECRTPYPVAEWMTNFRYKASPHCAAGMLKLIKES